MVGGCSWEFVTVVELRAVVNSIGQKRSHTARRDRSVSIGIVFKADAAVNARQQCSQKIIQPEVQEGKEGGRIIFAGLTDAAAGRE